jgi:hypothetical protein
MLILDIVRIDAEQVIAERTWDISILIDDGFEPRHNHHRIQTYTSSWYL